MDEPTSFYERIKSETIPQLEQHAEIIQLIIEACNQAPDNSQVKSQALLDGLNKDFKAVNEEIKSRQV